MAKKTPETDFGVKKCRRKKIGISQLKPNFMKIWIQPAQPKICGKNRVEPAQPDFWVEDQVEPAHPELWKNDRVEPTLPDDEKPRG